jgi:hypothetical protein
MSENSLNILTRIGKVFQGVNKDNHVECTCPIKIGRGCARADLAVSTLSGDFSSSFIKLYSRASPPSLGCGKEQVSN